MVVFSQRCWVFIAAFLVLTVVCFRLRTRPKDVSEKRTPRESILVSGRESVDILVVLVTTEARWCGAAVKALAHNAKYPHRLVFAIIQIIKSNSAKQENQNQNQNVNRAIDQAQVDPMIRRRVTLLSYYQNDNGRLGAWSKGVDDLWTDEKYIALCDGDFSYRPTRHWDALLEAHLTEQRSVVHATGTHKPGFLCLGAAHEKLPVVHARLFSFQTTVLQPAVAVGLGGGITMGFFEDVQLALRAVEKFNQYIPNWLAPLYLSAFFRSRNIPMFAAANVTMASSAPSRPRDRPLKEEEVKTLRTIFRHYLRAMECDENTGDPGTFARLGIFPGTTNELQINVKYGDRDVYDYEYEKASSPENSAKKPASRRRQQADNGAPRGTPKS